MLGKYLLRFILFFGSVWLLASLFLALGLQELSFMAAKQYWLWSLLLLLYMSFWFSLAYFIGSLGRHSHFNASSLVVVWLIFVVLMPGILQYLTEASYPIPSRSGLITQTREASVAAQRKAADILDQYVEEHPELASNKEELNMSDFGSRYFTVLSEVEEAMKPAADSFAIRLAARDKFIKELSLLSPALLGQEMMNELSATANHHYRYLEADAYSIKAALRNFFLRKILLGQELKSAEISQLPSFTPGEATYQADLSWMLRNSLLLLGIIAGLLAWGLAKFRENTYLTYSHQLQAA